jgi:hypothetical protein
MDGGQTSGRLCCRARRHSTPSSRPDTAPLLIRNDSRSRSQIDFSDSAYTLLTQTHSCSAGDRESKGLSFRGSESSGFRIGIAVEYSDCDGRICTESLLIRNAEDWLKRHATQVPGGLNLAGSPCGLDQLFHTPPSVNGGAVDVFGSAFRHRRPC